MLNPDGVNIAINGPEASLHPGKVKSMDLTGTQYSNWKSNSNGVDLNRNYPFNWNSEISNTTNSAARYYPGPYAASEPETRAMIAFLENTDFCMLVDFHIYIES